MPRRFEHSATYDCTPATLHAALTDPAYWDARVAAVGGTGAKLDALAATEGGVETGFSGYAGADGLSAPEGPQPEVMLPVVRWGLPPRTTLTFTVGPGERVRLETIFQSDHTDQAMTISLDGRELTHVAIRRAAEPIPLLLDLPAGAGEHTLAFEYANSYAQPGSNRVIAVLFRALRVRRG